MKSLRRGSRRGMVSRALVLVLAFLAPPAEASVTGTRPAPIASYQIYGDAIATGNTLMVPDDPMDEEVNSLLLPSSEAFVSGFPCDGVLEGAYLFWTGSIEGSVDDTADFTMADGTQVNNLVADHCYTVPTLGSFYYCRANITSLLQGHTTGCGYNGMYHVGDVRAMVGDYDSPDPNNGSCFAQGKYAAWSMILVYSEPDGFFRREVVIYDGFLHLDENSYNPTCGVTNPTHGVDNFSIGGFTVGDPPRGKLILFALEGDDQLGIPPQTACTTCYDYLKFNGVKLFDQAMYPNNLFNGSTSLTGVDIDEFDIGETGFNLLQPGQTLATIEVGSGDGCVSWSDPACPVEAEGGGESFLLGWMMLSLDTVHPFFSENSSIQFDDHTLGVGESVGVTIRIQNDGNMPATQVVVWETLPSGLAYVPGTTTVNGAPVADVAGTSPLFTPQGLGLGTMDYQGPTSSKVIRLTLRVQDTVPNGSVLCSSATVDCTQLEPTETPADCLTVEAPDIADPLLEVQDLNGGFAEPGDVLRYRATLANNGNDTATGFTFTMDLPPYVKNLTMIGIPSGSSDQSSPSGGANGTGLVDVRNITIYGVSKDAVQIIFDVTIFSTQDFLAAGISSDEIDGLALPAQGTLSAASLPADLPTNQVIVYLTYRATLEGSQKLGADVDGGRCEPQDVLRYTLEVHNQGNVPATVTITDDLPAGVGGCVIISGPAQAVCIPAPAGANQTGMVFANSVVVPPNGGIVSVVFEVSVAADAADGLSIVNSALIEVAENPAENRTVTAPQFIVYNRPDFVIAEKIVVDENGAPFEPGDALTFTIRYRNEGNRTASNVVVTDQVSPFLANVVPGQAGVYTPPEIRWDVGDVAVSEEVLLTFTANIVSPLDNGTVITNQASLTAAELSAAVLTNQVNITVTSAPNLSGMLKSVTTQDLDNDGQVSPGDRVDYTIVIRNTGNSVARNVIVTDGVDPNLESVIPGQGGQLAGGTITWNVGDVGLSPAGDVTLTFSALIVTPLEDGTIISNQAFATADAISLPVPSDDPATPDPDDPTRLVVHSQAVVSIAKTVSDVNGGDPMPGDTLAYQITIANSGNAPALNLTVTDSLPAELTNPVPGQGGQLSGQQITWTPAGTPALARIVPGQPVVLSFTADLVVPLPNGTQVCNQADVAGWGSSSPACVTVLSYPVLTGSTKVAVDLDGDGVYNPGDRVHYDITVINTGTETVTNLQVTDTLDARLTNVTVGQGGSLAGNLISWPPIPSIQPNDQVLLSFEADIVVPLENGASISNQGMITSSEVPGPTGTDDPATPAPGDPTVIVVVSTPDLSASIKEVEDLTGSPNRVEPGDTLRYTLRIGNTGTAIIHDLTVSDTVSIHLENVVPGEGGQLAGDTITWDSSTTPALATLSPLDPPVALTFTAQVRVPTPNGTVVRNQGFITHSDDPNPVPTDDPRTVEPDDSTDVTVISAADLTASTKTAADESGNLLPPGAQVVPGQLIRYTLTLTNQGNDAARNLVVRDPVDPSLSVVDIGQGGQLSGGEIRWQAASTPELQQIDPGGEVSLTFSARVVLPSDNGTVIRNQGFIIGDDIAEEMPTDDPATAALDDPVELVVLSSPDVTSSIKSVEDLNGGDFRPGDQVRYHIVIRNTGNALARDLTVTDSVDGASLEDIQAGQGGLLTGSDIRWDSGTTPALQAVGISPAGDVELTILARIKRPLDDGTPVSNQAFLLAAGMSAPEPSDDPATADVNDPTVFRVRSAPDLSGLLKSVLDQNGGDPAPGDLLTYTILAVNQGDMSARDVAISDPVDVQNLTDVTPLDGGVLSGSTIQWSLATIEPDQQYTLRFTARIKPLTPGGTRIDNQASLVSSTISDPVLSDDPATPGVDDDPTRVVVVASPDFTASPKGVRDVNAAPLLPGEELVYTLVIRNTGNTFASSVTVTDPLDSHLENIVPGQNGRLQGNSIIWDQAAVPALTRMDPGDELVLSFQATVVASTPDGTQISNRGSVTAAELSQPQLTEEALITVRFPVLGDAEKVVADLNQAPFEPEDRIRYTITIPNRGSANATGVSVTDQIDTMNLTDILPHNGGVYSNGIITWNPGTIPANSTLQLSFEATIRSMTAAGTRISNQARVNATELPQPVLTDDPTTPAVDDPTVIEVLALPDLSQGTKTVEDLNGGVVEPGDVLRYTVLVTNTGNTWAANVRVVDPIDTRYLEDIQPGQGGSYSGSEIRWDSSTTQNLAMVGQAPANVELTFTARVKEDVANGTVIGNQATYTCDQLPIGTPSDDPSTPEVDDPTRVTVIAAPVFTTSRKEVEDLNGGLTEPGDSLEYTILVINSGSEPSSNTRVRDSVPARTVYLTGTTTLNGLPVPDAPGGGSPLALGMSVRSARPGAPDGVVYPDDGSGTSNAVAVVTFRVRVEASAVSCGATISNKAWVQSLETDPTGTNVAEVTVGQCPNLNRTIKTWRLLEDHGEAGVVDPGDSVAYEIAIENSGPSRATQVEFVDGIPNNTSYLPGTLTLDGLVLSDGLDGDPGSVVSGRITVRAGEIPGGQLARIGFAVRVEQGPRIVNQGQVSCNELPDEPTDDDGDETNGDNPTVIPVSTQALPDLSATRKSVEDLDGGAVLPGDELRYTVELINLGRLAARSVRVTDVIPAQTIFVPGSLEIDGRSLTDAADGDAGLFDPGSGSAIFTQEILSAGSDVQLAFRVRIKEEVSLGTIIDNHARVAAESVDPFDTNHVRLMVGGGPGTGGITGRVFIDLQERNGRFDKTVDEALEGYQLQLRLISDAGPGALVATATSDEEGRFFLVDLEPGPYSLGAFSSTGTEYVRAAMEGNQAVAAGEIRERDLPVDPAGRIYSSSDGNLLAGATISVFYDDGQKVPSDRLPYPSQQDQVTDATGMYAFDLETGHQYRLIVTPPSPAFVFPSVRIPPQDGFAADLLEGGKVVEADRPDIEGDTRYFLRFDLGDEVLNNHVPLDRLDSLLRLDKRVNKRVASVGDIVTYTITLKNGSGQDLVSDWSTTGVWISDRPPRGFAYIGDSARVNVLASNGIRKQTYGQNSTPRLADTRNGLIEFGPYPLEAGDTLQIRYHMALGSDVKVGDHHNRARAHIQGSILASNQASAQVRVVHDPVFDEALVIGKVFCDLNSDGLQNFGNSAERGIAGARIYIDTGWYAETDSTGKYHLRGIEPGMHALKIDVDSLPPGSQTVGSPTRVLHLTRGLPAKLNFPVNCRERMLTATSRLGLQGPDPKTTLLTGDVDSRELTFQGRPVTLPGLQLWQGESAESEQILAYDLVEGALEQLVQFGVAGPGEEDCERWILELLGPDGDPFETMSGSGAPGGSLSWDAQERQLNPGTYQARLQVYMTDGTRLVSAPVAFGIGIPAGEVDPPIYPARLEVNGEEIELKDAATFSYHVPVREDGSVSLEVRRANGETISMRLLAVLPPQKRKVSIEGNLASNRIAVDGTDLSVAFADLDVATTEEKALLGPEGLKHPVIFQLTGDRSAVKSWRLEISDAAGVPVHEVTAAGPPPEKIFWEGEASRSIGPLGEGWYGYRLWATGGPGQEVMTTQRFIYLSRGPREVELPADDMFTEGTARPTLALRDKLTEVAGQLKSGAAKGLKIEVHSDNQGGERRALARTERRARSVRRLLTQLEAPGELVTVEAKGATQPKVPNLGKKNMAANRRLTLRLAREEQPADKPVVEAEPGLAADGRAVSREESGVFRTELERLPGDVIQLVWGDPQGRRFSMPVGLPGPEPAPVAPPEKPPVHLRVALPPEGVEIRAEKLYVHGATDPGNQVSINGHKVPVDPQGNFRFHLPVKVETAKIEVIASNKHGNTAKLSSPVKVARHTWFLLAMADTALAQAEAGEHLDGVTKRTSTVVADDQILLHGRAVLYLKARIKGKYLFDQYRITAHFDTAKGDEEAFLRQAVDPERYYPVYGDSALEVQDVQARRKLYVLVEADDSSLKIGNFSTKLKGIDVLRYDRTLYGGQVVFKKVFADDFATEVKAHVADKHQQVRHAHVELTPTGGSLYYLPHTFVLEGSEQVRLTVRDRETGMVLMRVPKQRDLDYAIRYREGRILFNGPVASSLDAAGLSMSSNVAAAAEGNPVYIEIDYEYEGGRGPGEVSWAVQAHETYREMLKVGGTYIREGRIQDDFTLWGVDLTLQDPKHKQTFLKGEFARSQNTDADSFMSPDGGLSFMSLGTPNPGAYQRPDSGNAWKITAGSEIGAYFGKNKPFLNLSGYFQRLEPGFFSNGMLTEQGQQKAGGRVSWHPLEDGTLDFRYDAGMSSVYASGASPGPRELERHILRLGYLHKLDEMELSGEYLHAIVYDNAVHFGWNHSDATGAGVKYRFTKRWEAFARQEAILNSDGILVGTFGDRMKTSLGVSYNITDDLKLSLTESVRWSGDNATVLGFSTKLTEKAKVYVNERFNLTGSRYISTTVVGAEDEPLKGVKTYGEYQLNGASSGMTNRAVLGLNNHFKWGQGWSADLHYERTQVFGDGGFGPGMPGVQLQGGTGSAILPDGIMGGTGFEGVPGNAMPSMNSYGSFLAGDSSRDALGAGLEYKGRDDLKLSLKFQFRYDDADDDMITSTPVNGLTSSARPWIKDRMQFLVMAAMVWKWTPDLSLALRLNFADTEALETKRDGQVYVERGNEARLLEGSVGLAFRPVHYDWVAVLGKYTVLLEKRPVDLTAGLGEQSQSHVFTVMPIFEIESLRLQIVEKFALKFVHEDVDGLPEASGSTILWINRLNYHMIENLDIGAEYRLLKSFLAKDTRSGFLLEVAYVLKGMIRIGVGYNFTSFSDNELESNYYDHGGFFFRVVGQY